VVSSNHCCVQGSGLQITRSRSPTIRTVGTPIDGGDAVEQGQFETTVPGPHAFGFFLLTHGAAAPYTLTALSDRFDPVDGPLDELAHAELITDVTINALRRPGP
jgi:hypothetical protein